VCVGGTVPRVTSLQFTWWYSYTRPSEAAVNTDQNISTTVSAMVSTANARPSGVGRRVSIHRAQWFSCYRLDKHSPLRRHDEVTDKMHHRTVVFVSVWACSRRATISGIPRTSSYFYVAFSTFASYPGGPMFEFGSRTEDWPVQENESASFQIKSWSFPSTSFPISHSVFILSFDAR
jgi:hypothetical protein